MAQQSLVIYDEQANVIFVDHTNMYLTQQLFTQVVAEVRELASGLASPVYMLVCLANTTVAPDLAQAWGNYTQQLLPYVLGVVRYQVNDMLTNLSIRFSTIQQHLQGVNSHIYPDREAALAAIRQLEAEAASNNPNSNNSSSSGW
jgi:hypothetical protein